MTTPIYITKTVPPDLELFCSGLKEIWDKGVYTNSGPISKKLEEKLKLKMNTLNISLVSNATLGLMIALKILISDTNNGEVITTPFTFPATSNSIDWLGMKPIFCDINKDNFNIDVDKIEEKITKYTKAIIPVNVFGFFCDLEKLELIRTKYDIPIIYDAAHCFGSSLTSKNIYSFGDAWIYSFHATKIFSTIEGGAIIFREDNNKYKSDKLKNFGIEDDGSFGDPGINAKMNELQALFGLLSLDNLDCIFKERKRVYNRYKNNLQNIKKIFIKEIPTDIQYNYSYFPILLENSLCRDNIYIKLREQNIYARKYFYPLCTSIKKYKIDTLFPVAENVSNRIICLPMYSELDNINIDKICKIIKRNIYE